MIGGYTIPFMFPVRIILIALPIVLVIALLAVPILIQVLFNSALAYWLNRRLGESHRPVTGAAGERRREPRGAAGISA